MVPPPHVLSHPVVCVGVSLSLSFMPEQNMVTRRPYVCMYVCVCVCVSVHQYVGFRPFLGQYVGFGPLLGLYFGFRPLLGLYVGFRPILGLYVGFRPLLSPELKIYAN